MIRKWRIGNFKAFKDSGDLELTPMTVFAGTNSAGKSSLLQSILVLQQTFRYAPEEIHLALNGPLVQLGYLEDLLHNPTSGAKRASSFDLNFTIDLAFPHARFSADPSEETRYCAQLTAQFARGRRRGRSVPRVRAVELEEYELQADGTESDRTYIKVTRRRPSPNRIQSLGFQSDVQFGVRELESLEYSVAKLDAHTRSELKEDYEATPKIVGCALEHFLPDHLALQIDQAVARREELLDSLSVFGHRYRTTNAAATPLPGEVIAVLREIGDEAPLKFRPGIESLIDELNGIDEATVDDFRREFRKKQVDSDEFHIPTRALRSRLETAMPAPEETALYDLELAGLHTRTYLISRFFDRGIHYLGPLRQKPQPVYPIQAHVRPWEVGTEGERTAAVLNLYGDEKIKYVPASTFNETGAQSPGGIPLSETTLLEGVREWLRHMGVAFDIRTEDRGKSGYSVQVQTDECGPWLDLTNVGVGVSQVLPITVMALLAKGGHVLLLEQPELHLHPSVQASLADFLLSISLAGKQCVVESHGEYLVDRLRLRIAEAHLPDIGDKTSIYFVERKQGAAQVRRVEVSEYGAILDWPEGFFDQSQREGERILLAATKKRRALRAAKEKTR